MADSPKEPQPEEGLQERLPDEPPKIDPELDPELVKLPRPKTRIRPVTALAIIGICLTLTGRLLSDLRFSRQGDQPTLVPGIEGLSSDLDNRFIEIEVQPDRPQAVRLVPHRSQTGQVLVPVLGSAGKFWLLLEASPWNESARTDERYRGRLTRLADLDFEEPLQSYFSSGQHIPRPIRLSEIRTALQSNAGSVHDASGDLFSVKADTAVRFKEVDVKRIRILAVSTDPYDDEAGWSLALQNAGIMQAGGVQAGSGAVSSTPNSWTFDVTVPGGLQEVQSKLASAKLFAAKASEISAARAGTWSQLSLDGDDILLGKARVGFKVRSISLEVAPTLDANAYVLNTTEVPGTYWYVPILFFALAGLGMLFAFGLYRRLR